MPEYENLHDQALDRLKQYRAFWEVLTSKERLALVEFIKAPMHKCNRYVAELAAHLNIALKNDRVTLLTDEKLISRYSSGRKTDSAATHLSKLTQQFDTLLKLIEQFIVYTHVLNDKHTYQKALVKSLKERNNHGLFLKAAADFRTSLNKTPLTLMVAADKWWLEHQCYYDTYADLSNGSNTFEQNINSFDTFYELTILRNYMEMFNRNVPSTELIEKFDYPFESIAKGDIEKKPTVAKLYLEMINILKTKSEIPNQYYLDFKASFHKAQQLAKVDLFILSKTCVNYLSGLYYQFGLPWLDELFEWLMFQYNNGLYAVEGGMSDGDYLNFFLVAQALEKYEFLEQFKKSHSKLLDISIKDQVLALCQSYTFLREKKIMEAWDLLEEVFPLNSPKQVKYDLRVKELRVMLCYENFLLDQADEDKKEGVVKTIDNLNKYFQRLVEGDHLSKERTSPHINFRWVVSKLYYYYKKTNENEKVTILIEILNLLNSNAPFSNRFFINQQLSKIAEKIKNEREP